VFDLFDSKRVIAAVSVLPSSQQYDRAYISTNRSGKLHHAMSSIPDKGKEWVTLALALSLQEWSQLGLGNDPATRAVEIDHKAVVERAAALLTMRVIALIVPLGTFANLSTTCMCRQILTKPKYWPARITDSILELIHEYCLRILTGYKEVPYHNFQHAYHVILSCNKLLDMLLQSQDESKGGKNGKKVTPITYGLRHDPLSLMALLFAAIVHDVEHQVSVWLAVLCCY
jgi:3'5'-cyclic nucleotide phosphodiesterase